MTFHHQLLIEGRKVPGEGETLCSIEPANGRIFWQGASASAEQCAQAVSAAREAFPVWAQTAVETRIGAVTAYQSRLEDKAEELAECISRETGKALWEARGEVATMIAKVDLSIDAYHERTGHHVQDFGDGQRILTHRPHGALAVYGPYNFPGHLPNGHIVPALIAGNTVVFKPSEHAPAVAELMLDCLLASGLPDGVVNLVQGGVDTARALSQEPGLDGLLFTGSSTTGRILSQQFADTPGKILALEMGGNNPLLVTECADIDAAVHCIVQSAFITAGQRCTCARRLILVESRQNARLVERLVEASRKIQVGLPDDDVYYGPMVSEHAAKQLLAAEQSLIALGGKSLLAMHSPLDGVPCLTPGIIDMTGVDKVPDEEHFGPLLQVYRTGSFGEAIELANDTRFGLAAGLLSDHEADWRRFHLLSRAGIVNWNNPTTGASGAAPFGGTGDSGNLRPGAWYAADYCAYPVASVIGGQLRLPQKFSPGLSGIVGRE